MPALSETEEFEFRARAEREALPPGKEKSTDVAKQHSEGARTAGDLIGAAVEPMMSMASSGVLQPISGLAGLGAMGTNALGITNTPPADVVNAVQGAAYQPKTAGGQDALRAFGAIPQAAEEAISRDVPGSAPLAGKQRFGGAGTKPSGDWSPAAKAVGETVLKGLPQIAGMKGGAKLAETPGLLKPKAISPEIKALADKGVVTTPGQRGGTKSWRDTSEQKLESLAGGQSITNRRREAVQKWSAEKLDDALKTAGAKPVPVNKSGRDAYLYTKTELSKGYQALLPKLTGDLHNAAAGTSLGADLAAIRAAGTAKGAGIRPTDRSRLSSIIDNDVLARFDASGKIGGDALKQVQDVLNKEIGKYKKGNVSERNVAEHLEAVNGKLWEMIRRENPKYAGDLKKLDTAWAKFQTAALASLSGGKGQEGVFTPNQYLGAIQRKDMSKNKGKFVTGTAPGQTEAESASRILGNTVSDSGTPGRQQLIELVKNPFASLGGIAANVATPIIYSKPVQKALQTRALKGTNRPATRTGALLGAGATLPGSTDQNGIGQ
jgi:hypothetical protein